MVNMKSDNAKTYSEWLMDDHVEFYLMDRSGNVYQVRICLENKRKYFCHSKKTTVLDDRSIKRKTIVFNRNVLREALSL